jgi:hypothetical protein
MLGIVCCAAMGLAQTAEELVAKNTEAKGGIEKIKAVKTFKAVGKLESGGFRANIDWEAKRPEMFRQNVTIQGMTEVEAYDGTTGWNISPFEGKKDAQLVGEEDLRNLAEDADFDGPLIDAQAKGNRIEYLGMDTVDGDDAYRLKVTLKNGDIIYYYLDPATFLEFRTEKQQFIRGNVRETVTELGSYKPVNGVLYAFSLENGPKRSTNRTKINLDRIEANIPLDDSLFQMPGGAAAKPATEQKPSAQAPKTQAAPKKK